MKKIDLHIHTIPTFRDSHFDFNLSMLQSYVQELGIDAIAITNHDLFDAHQYKQIQDSLSIAVFPGIELTIESGHVLIIDDGVDIDDFNDKADKVSQIVRTIEDRVSVKQVEDIFGDLSQYLVIPHYEKSPSLKGAAFSALEPHFDAGEVDSPKKFVRMMRGDSKLTPVLFSDLRISDSLENFPSRQTFVDCGEISISSFKSSFRDKSKVSLSESDGHSLFYVLQGSLPLSTGLNVLFGKRSTGKTWTLNAINKEDKESIKYIRQFSLVQQDEEASKKEFEADVAKRKSVFSDEYLTLFRNVVNDVIEIDLSQGEKEIEAYVSSLIKSANEEESKDAFSNTALFGETEFTFSKDETLEKLISAIRFLIENIEYRSVIDRHLDIDSLKALARELIEISWSKIYLRKKMSVVNEIINDVKQKLRLRTSATPVTDVDLYNVAIERQKVERFDSVVKAIQAKSIIHEEGVRGYKVVVRRLPFQGAGEVKSVSGTRAAFGGAFREYSNPYMYLKRLRENESLTPSEFYKYFVKIDYQILNKDGFSVSGGERSEFRLLREISDAQNYEILLIDEPESSFDNLFLMDEVNTIIKDISKTMPVVVVTHNSTVGASILPDYVLYAEKYKDNGSARYRLYHGYPHDRVLTASDGNVVDNFTIQVNSLEAGVDPYENRMDGYENLKN